LVVWGIEFVCINATSRTKSGFFNLDFCQISLGFGQRNCLDCLDFVIKLLTWSWLSLA
jgi:hypothetical protein